MPTVPGPVDDNGNIIVPDGGGVTIPLKEMSTDSTPVQIDISAIPMTFTVEGRFSKSVPVNPDDALGKLLTLTKEDGDKLSSKPRNFSLFDMTDPNVPVPLWIGKIWRAS